MILYDTLFKPRRLPAWWVRFTEKYPMLPNLVAITGLTWICYSIAVIINASDTHGQSQVVESLGAVSHSQSVIDKFIGLRAAYHHLFPEQVRILLANLYGNISMYMVVPFLFLLEILYPCNPSQPLVSKGFLQDALWYAIDTPLSLIILFPVAAFLRSLFNHYLGFLALGPATAWPVYLQVLAAVLLAEFFIWFNHFVRHKIRPLWLFHAVHHSQKEMNVFTDDRAHIIDLLIGSLLSFIPFFIFNVSNLYIITIIGIYKPIHNRFIHSNLKINLGWLSWIITTPQFHRVHHSVEEEHADKNFGIYLSIYDYLFGTAWKSRDVYPQTGIADLRFPTEDKVAVSQLPKNLVLQMIYPFKQLYEKFQQSRRIRAFRRRRPRVANRIVFRFGRYRRQKDPEMMES